MYRDMGCKENPYHRRGRGRGDILLQSKFNYELLTVSFHSGIQLRSLLIEDLNTLIEGS